MRRTGTAKIADFLDDGSVAREEENKFSFKLKNETETLEMKLKGKNDWFQATLIINVYLLISIMG